MTPRDREVAPTGGADAPLHVIATAGHVDHGKSTLIRRLTGIDPDRLEEEKRRGLTIDLGFAWCTLPSGREIGFVDVPGHERFVRTMLAGVGPVRLVLFVVAADEGWKPQSEEHLEIVDVLAAEGAVIALTKADAADATALADREAEVRERVAGTALASAPIVACSALTGVGIAELEGALDALVAGAPTPPVGGRVRLFVDRVFTIAGAGTVVTGTLTSGHLAVGDEVELSPSGVRGRVRGLQTHRRTLDVASPISRVAVNVAGIERGAIERGEVVGHPGDWRTTSVFEAKLEPVRSLQHPLGSRGAFTLHAGAAERGASLRIYGGVGGVDPVVGEAAFARIHLSEPLAFEVGDRFVLRESGRRETVAGGIVLDADPPARPGRDAPQRLSRRAAATRDELPALLLDERGIAPAADVDRLAGAEVDNIPHAERAAGWWISTSLLARASDGVRAAVEMSHDRGEVGIDLAAARAEVVEALRRNRVDIAPGLADAIVDRLAEDPDLERAGARLALAGRGSSGDDDAVRELVEAVAAGEPTPPTLAELGASPAVLGSALERGLLVRIGPELVVTPAFVDRAVDAVRATGSRGITVSALRQALGTSRRYAVPLAEHLDRTGRTRRSGDLRFARGV